MYKHLLCEDCYIVCGVEFVFREREGVPVTDFTTNKKRTEYEEIFNHIIIYVGGYF